MQQDSGVGMRLTLRLPMARLAALIAAAAIGTLLLLPGSMLGGRAKADEVPPVEPVCSLPEVLQIVAYELEARGIHGQLDPEGVGERSAPGAVTALCSIKVLLPFYDTDRFGSAPQYRMVLRSYQVRHQAHSLVVKLLD